jgi:hypothetical protein
MKKQRGLKRYYRNLATQNDFEKWTQFDFNKNPDAWFDRWHMHFDWKGFGNNSFKRRKPHLDKLFRHFDILVSKTKNIKTEFQLFALLLDYDSSSDSLYLHTPNPNNNDFPLKWTTLSQTSTLTNKELDNYIGQLNGYDKLYGKTDQTFCILYQKGIGNRIEYGSETFG